MTTASPSPHTIRLRPRTPLRESGDTTLVRLVRHYLLTDIEHAFHPQLRLPPIRQIANELGVSVGTANQAVKDLVAAGILFAQPRTGTTLAPGCTIDDVRKMRRQGDTLDEGAPLSGKDVQVLMCPKADAMVLEMSESFARAIAQQGGHVHFTEYSGKNHHWADAADGDATVLFQPHSSHERSVTWEVEQPLVVVATEPVLVDKVEGYDILTVDDEQGGFAAGRYARAAGLTDACFIGRRYSKQVRDRYSPSCTRRLSGFERGFGRPVTEQNRLMVGSHDIHNGSRVVADFVKLDPRPELVFCSADDPAIGFLIGAHAYGLNCGEHYQLIGFDRQEAAMNVPGGPITSVDVPRQQLGTRAAELIASRMANIAQPVRRVFLGCSVFEGRTVKTS